MAIKEPDNLNAYRNFLLLSILAMILPFHVLYLYFIHGKFNIVVGVCIYLVILWVINTTIFFVERKERQVNKVDLDKMS